MHRMIAALLALMLLLGCALAEVDRPAIKNPRERYDVYFEQTDGSEQAVFMVVDGMNDELADVEKYGSLIAKHSFKLAGITLLESEIILQDSAFGRMIIADAGDGSLVYSLRDGAYTALPGEPAERVEGFPADEFDWYWESYHFPYGRLELMHGLRQDEAGNSYMLVKSDETMTFEFAMGSDMRIEQLRVYDHLSEDEMVLSLVVDYSVGPAIEIREDVLALMREDFHEQ